MTPLPRAQSGTWPPLNRRAALDGAVKRPLGEAWVWSRKSSAVDISPLVACTIAHWGAKNTPDTTMGIWSIREIVEELRQKELDNNAEAPTSAPAAIAGLHPNFVPL